MAADRETPEMAALLASIRARWEVTPGDTVWIECHRGELWVDRRDEARGQVVYGWHPGMRS